MPSQKQGVEKAVMPLQGAAHQSADRLWNVTDHEMTQAGGRKTA